VAAAAASVLVKVVEVVVVVASEVVLVVEAVAALAEAVAVVSNRTIKRALHQIIGEGLFSLFNDCLSGENSLELEIVLSDIANVIAASALFGIEFAHLDVFLLGLLARQPKRNDARAMRHVELIGKIIAQLVGISIAVFKELGLFLNGYILNFLNIGKIDHGVCEVGNEAKKISLGSLGLFGCISRKESHQNDGQGEKFEIFHYPKNVFNICFFVLVRRRRMAFSLI
jgi:hypothetical protein